MKWIILVISIGFMGSAVAQSQQLYPSPQVESAGMYNMDGIKEAGFSFSFMAEMGDIKGQNIITINNHDPEIPAWKLSVNNEGKMYITRYIPTGSGGLFDWNLTFWDPEYANFSTLPDNATVGFVVVQEPDQVRVHVGMPDGIFDCMYMNYGIQGTGLHYGTFVEQKPFNSQLILHNMDFWNQPLCRTDAFAYAVEEFYEGATAWSGLIGNENTELKETVYNDDAIRIAGGCYSTLDTFEPTGNKVQIMQYSMEAENAEAVTNQAYVVYPNPTSGLIRIRFSEGFLQKEDLQVTLYDLVNEPQASRAFQMAAGQREISWEVSGTTNTLPTGVYLLEVRSSQGVFRTRIAVDCGCNAR